MPVVYLSPSTQEWNSYVTGSGSEEYQMNRLADAMVPYLVSSAIQYRRNRPEMTAATSIREANTGYYDLYLALHSNASAESSYGTNRGIIAFYYPGSAEGHRAAELFVQGLRDIYPLPDLVRMQATTALGEVRQPRFPSVLLELGYHDNYADARWVENNTTAIAQTLVRAVTQFFGIPFIWPIDPVQGTVNVGYGTLNLRSRPSPDAPVLTGIPNGARVTVYGRWQGWLVVHHQGYVGYAAEAYVALA